MNSEATITIRAVDEASPVIRGIAGELAELKADRIGIYAVPAAIGAAFAAFGTLAGLLATGVLRL
jgi:hypothetical protein